MDKKKLFAQYIDRINSVTDDIFLKILGSRYRFEYDQILVTIEKMIQSKEPPSVSQVILRSCVLSQPTLHKRIHELIALGFIEVQVGLDRRERNLAFTKDAENYLEMRGNLILEAAHDIGA